MLAAPEALVRAFAVDLDRRSRRYRQLDRAYKLLGKVLGRADGPFGEQVTLGVACRGRGAELDLCPVALVEAHEVLGQPGRRADQDEEQTRRGWVKRSGVASLDLASGGVAAQPSSVRAMLTMIEPPGPGGWKINSMASASADSKLESCL